MKAKVVAEGGAAKSVVRVGSHKTAPCHPFTWCWPVLWLAVRTNCRPHAT